MAADPSSLYDRHKGAVYQSSQAALNMYSTDFNNHRGASTVQEAGIRVVRYAMLDENGPTGKFVSEEYNPETGDIPW